MRKNASEIIAGTLLILPVLYVASYLAMVVPEGIERQGVMREPLMFPIGYSKEFNARYWDHYRFGGKWTANFYWPLESIDQQLRPFAHMVEELPGEMRIVPDDGRP